MPFTASSSFLLTKRWIVWVEYRSSAMELDFYFAISIRHFDKSMYCIFIIRIVRFGFVCVNMRHFDCPLKCNDAYSETLLQRNFIAKWASSGDSNTPTNLPFTITLRGYFIFVLRIISNNFQFHSPFTHTRTRTTELWNRIANWIFYMRHISHWQ